MAKRRAYTLVELLITIAIIGIMAWMIMFALFSAQEQAKVQKTRALITRLDSIIQTRYEGYRTRRVPITMPPPPKPTDANYATEFPVYLYKIGKRKLDCLHDLMRLELPERWSDILDPPVIPGMKVPSSTVAYQNRWQAVTGSLSPNPAKNEHQGAECLYLIVMEAVAQEGDSRDVFRPDQTGDVDGDGFREFIDAWGQPIRFLRWAPGIVSQRQMSLVQFKTDDTATPGTNSMQIRLNNVPAPPAKIGGAVVILSKYDEPYWDRVAEVSGFTYDNASRTAVIDCTTPDYSGQQPFGGNGPQPEEQLAFMGEYAFDPARIYPRYSTTVSRQSPRSHFIR